MLTILLASLAILSLLLALWQWVVSIRFPIHTRLLAPDFAPAVTVLKPLKGCDAETQACLRSWFQQEYQGAVQILFGVREETDPACALVKQLLAEFQDADAELVVCPESLGANAKVSSLIQLRRRAKHEVIVVSDADVRVPADFLTNAVAPLREEKVGLVNCFYSLANPTTLAMRWEAVAVNGDFWSQVLQSLTLKPMDFALGAVMVTRRKQLAEVGGFEALVDFLADDYRLGNLIAAKGWRIEIAPVVVECWESPLTWRQVWAHQLRWARTIRVCQPLPYFFSVLSNGTLWPLLWLALDTSLVSATCAAFFWAIRVAAAQHQQARLTQSRKHMWYDWMVPVKDLLQVLIWAASFLGNQVVWRGQVYRVERGGRLVKV
ncbi:MAG: bacteriohopanetetrol glucosamine biosynthesis glycosyltransferase HpnI [Verrucomicrobiota bacterium]